MKRTSFLRNILAIIVMLTSYSTIQAQVVIEDNAVVNEDESHFLMVRRICTNTSVPTSNIPMKPLKMAFKAPW